MPLLEIPVPSLLAGVSQQPAANRQPGQVTACDNGLLHVVNGLAKRHGTRHLARLVTGRESVLLAHLINRDAVERYQVLVGERRVRVFSAIDGTEYPVKVNGTATDAGRGLAGAGTPIAYLNPRLAGGEVDQDEEFVIGAGDWLSVVGNSVTSYVSGRGPFGFGRFESASAVTADTVAEVGNAAAASVSDIYLDSGLFAETNAFSVFVKKSSSAINDVELSFDNTFGVARVTARFDIAADGTITLGATTTTGALVSTDLEDMGNGWYRCGIRTTAVPGLPAVGFFGQGGTRRIQIRFHTNAATPANKRALLFGARCYSGHLLGEPLPSYIVARSDLFRALTVADSTFLLNTETVPAMEAGVTTSQPLRCYVWVRQGGLDDVLYTVKVYYSTGGAPASASFTHGPTTLATSQTDADIAEGLRALIDAHADLVAVRVGSVIKITHALGTAGNAVRAVEVTDSRGDSTMVAISQNEDGFSFIGKFTDLPLISDHDHVVFVSGNPERETDDYWTKFKADNGSSFGAGHWEESIRPGVSNTRPGIPFRIDAGTMPLRLSRLQDDAVGTVTGTPLGVYFDVSEVDWDDRLVGDLDSNPDPSFIGEPIRDLFLYRGRLGFLAADAVVLSETAELFNFWRTTVLDLVDTDPIDVTSGTKDTVEFRNAAATADSLLLFSDRHQFQLLGDPVLTPATAQLVAVRAFENLTQAVPVDAGRGVVFAKFDGAFSNLMEAALLQDDTSFRFDDLTVQAPRYIPGPLLQLAHSSLTGLTVARGSEASTLTVHQTFHDDQENRLQSAVHRWLLDPSASVRGLGFLDADLVLLVEREEGWFLEAMLTNSSTVEASGLPITLLDRRLAADQLAVTYDGGTDTTTVTLPYDISATATMRVVDAASGLLIPVTGQGNDYLELHGDYSDSALFVGEEYELSVTLTEAVIQDQGRNGGLVPRMGRPLDVQRLYLYLASTAFLRVDVEADLRPTTTEEFSAAGLGTGLLLEGALNTYSGDADFSVLGRSTEVDVVLRNATPFPSYVQSARWEVLHRQRAGLS